MPRWSLGLVVLLAAAHAFAEPSLDDRMNAALKAKKLAPKTVVKRLTTATAAWAVVGTKPKARAATEYLVLRVRAGDTAELRLAPPAAQQRRFDSVLSFEPRDVDGDGSEEAILVARWDRDLKQRLPPKRCRGCTQATRERADQLYVLGGSGAKLQIGFTHVLSYRTTSELLPRSRRLPKPSDEEILYGWTIAGNPPVVKLQRYKLEVAPAPRIKGLLDPVKHPLLGDSRDVPIAFK